MLSPPMSRSPCVSPSVHIARALLKASNRRLSPLHSDREGSSESSPSKLTSGERYKPSDPEDVGLEVIGPVVGRKSPRLANQARKLLIHLPSDSDVVEIGPAMARKKSRLVTRRRKLLLAGSPSDSVEDSERMAKAVEDSPNFKDELVEYICTNGLKLFFGRTVLYNSASGPIKLVS